MAWIRTFQILSTIICDVKWFLHVSSCHIMILALYIQFGGHINVHDIITSVHKKTFIKWQENETSLTYLSTNWFMVAFIMKQIPLDTLYFFIFINPQNNVLKLFSFCMCWWVMQLVSNTAGLPGTTLLAHITTLHYPVSRVGRQRKVG